MPEIVAITTTSETKTMVFSVPMMLRMTNILGKESAGPANNNAKAGPLPIPAPIRPWRIGTSVSVAKYIKAANMLAKKFVQTGQIARAKLSNAPPPQPVIAKKVSGESPTSICTYFPDR